MSRLLRRRLSWARRVFLTLRRPFSDAWYWLRCHVWTRYHILDLRNPEYRWGYSDPTQQYLYAAFALLVIFVEKEGGLEIIDWDWCVEHTFCEDPQPCTCDSEPRRTGKELRELYDWWKKGRAEDRANPDREWHELEDKDQEMLERLTKVRRALWT